jgi:hypothetical protein
LSLPKANVDGIEPTNAFCDGEAKLCWNSLPRL